MPLIFLQIIMGIGVVIGVAIIAFPVLLFVGAVSIIFCLVSVYIESRNATQRKKFGTESMPPMEILEYLHESLQGVDGFVSQQESFQMSMRNHTDPHSFLRLQDGGNVRFSLDKGKKISAVWRPEISSFGPYTIATSFDPNAIVRDCMKYPQIARLKTIQEVDRREKIATETAKENAMTFEKEKAERITRKESLKRKL